MRGWILDLYPGGPGEMVVWLKDEQGAAHRLVDRWSPSIYIAADERADLGVPLKVVANELAWTRAVMKRERITDRAESEMLEAKVKDARRVQSLAGRIERLGPFGTYRLYNVDLPPNQSYLYERDLFPLAYCEVNSSGGRLEWDLRDDVMEYDYRLPSLKTMSLGVTIDRLGKMPRDTDRIKEIRLKTEADERVIGGASEADSILELVRTVRALDPDFITTRDGDAFLLPYLIRRARANAVADSLSLDRDGTALGLPGKKGTSFFSYGKICYRPSAVKLCGRVHIDTSTSFSYSEAGLHGLFELGRVCRMPLQTASRASIGKALSSLQFYQAFKMNLPIPWKPTLAERFKDRAELLVADRGGFIFEPRMGLHESVAELDFACLLKDTIVKTRSGEKFVADVSIGTEIFTPFGWQEVSGIHRYRINQRMIRITLADGKKITCTPHHKFPALVSDAFEEKTADKIHKGNRLIVADELPVFRNDDLVCLFGVFTAEGCRVRSDQKYYDSARKTTRISHQCRVEFSIDKRETDFRSFIVSTLLKTYPGVHVYTKAKRGSNGITLVVAQKVAALDFLSRYDAFIANEHHAQDEMASFMRGFFEGDGSVNKKRNTVQCDQSSKNRFKLEVVCRYLRELGIGYRVGRYANKQGFSSISTDFLELSGLDGIVRYYTQIGFISQTKKESLRQAILTRIRKAKNYPNPRLGLYAKAKRNNALSFIHEVRVVGKEALGYNGTVYDLTLEWDEFPYYFANGILTHNSLYPSIMLKKNISAETVCCPCCPDSTNRVPELDWNVCQKVKGLVPRSMDVIVEKRLEYKKRVKAAGADRDRYDQCQAALKWIGVATFGYLGFNNAKFGRIDAHIAVCAWDRKILVDAARVAERRGYTVIHGIVDSLWLERRGAGREDYLELQAEIERETGFPLSFEGIYKWIAFLPSKVDPGLPVQNRYFGAYEDGRLKVRGVEARRHDTPLLFKQCQMEILRLLAEADSIEEARARLPECAQTFDRYAGRVESRDVTPEEMAFAMNLSKAPSEYVNRTLQSSAARQLAEEGVDLHAGEGVRYVIRNYSGAFRRAVPVDFAEAAEYDPERYIRLLAETCESVMGVFDARYDATNLVERYRHGHGLG